MFARKKDFDWELVVEQEMLRLLDDPEELAPLLQDYLEDDAGFSVFLDAVAPLCVGGDIMPKLVRIRDEVAFSRAEMKLQEPLDDEPDPGDDFHGF